MSAASPTSSFDTDTAQRLLTGRRFTAQRDPRPRRSTESHADALRQRISATLPDGVEAITGAELTAEQRRDVESDFLGFFQSAAARVRRHRHRRRRLQHPQHVLDRRRPAHPRVGVAAGDRCVAAPGRRLPSPPRRSSSASSPPAIGFGAGIGIAASCSRRWSLASDCRPPALVDRNRGDRRQRHRRHRHHRRSPASARRIRASRVAPLRRPPRRGRRALRPPCGAAWSGVIVTAVGVHGARSRPRRRPRARWPGPGSARSACSPALSSSAPSSARPAAAVLGAGPALVRGVTGRLARRNAMRNPRRTAASASALMVGTAVVGAVHDVRRVAQGVARRDRRRRLRR